MAPPSPPPWVPPAWLQYTPRKTPLKSASSIVTSDASSTSRINHGARPANHVSFGHHNRRLLTVPNKSQPYHAAPAGRRPSHSLMTSRTLSSGQMLIYLRDAPQTDHTVTQFRNKLNGPLGFDLEYRPNYIKGRPLNRTALIQLASTSLVLLVQVSAMSTFPDTIRQILQDPTIIKAGVGIQGDAAKLRGDFGIAPASFLELGYFARAIDQRWADTKGLISLARLVKTYEDRVLTKPRDIQMSNWEAYLTLEQQDYAASDANAALSVLQKLYKILPSIEPSPDHTLYLF